MVNCKLDIMLDACDVFKNLSGWWLPSSHTGDPPSRMFSTLVFVFASRSSNHQEKSRLTAETVKAVYCTTIT